MSQANYQSQTLQENKMGVMPVGRLLASMAVPMMISMLVQAVYNVVDSIFVSRISENALNAVSLAFPLQHLMIAFGAGTALGMNTLVSRSLGAKNQDLANRAAGTGIFLFAVTYILFALIGFFGARAFYLAQTDVVEIVEYGVDYTSICLGFSFGIFVQFCFEKLLQSTGRATISMITQLIGAVTNIILDPILIFGYFGLPAMGVKGAAIATVSGQILAAVVAMIANFKINKELQISIKNIRWNTEIAREIYRVGLPSTIMQSIGSVMTFGMNKILIAFTTTATAVFGAYFKLQSFVFMPIFGLNSGMVPIISYNYGAGKPDRIKRTIFLSLSTAVSIMIVGLLIFELMPAALLSLFDASDYMLSIGVPALRIIGTTFLFAGFCIISGSVCQAIGNPMHSLITSVCRQLVVLLPSAWLLAKTGRLELVWLAFPIAEIVCAILSAIFLRKTLKSASASIENR